MTFDNSSDGSNTSCVIQQIITALHTDIVSYAEFEQILNDAVEEGFQCNPTQILVQLLGMGVEVGYAAQSKEGSHVRFITWRGCILDRARRINIELPKGTTADRGYNVWLCLASNVDDYEIEGEQTMNLPNKKDDWRRQGQEQYLYGKRLIAQKYHPYRKGWEHDHCEFCGEKFSLANEDLKSGYSTEDGYHWICDQCFDDFKETFVWTVHDR